MSMEVLYMFVAIVFIIISLAPGNFEWNFRHVIFKQILVIEGWSISCEIALIGMTLDFIDDQSALVHAMAWCRQATSHYLSQCWPRSLSPYDVTRPQWVKGCTHIHRGCFISGLVWQNPASMTGTSNCTPQILWGVITCLCPWYLHISRYIPRGIVSVKETSPLILYVDRISAVITATWFFLRLPIQITKASALYLIYHS